MPLLFHLLTSQLAQSGDPAFLYVEITELNDFVIP